MDKLQLLGIILLATWLTIDPFIVMTSVFQRYISDLLLMSGLLLAATAIYKRKVQFESNN